MGMGPAEVPVGPTERGPLEAEAEAEATAEDVGMRGRFDGDGVVDMFAMLLFLM